MMNTPLVSVCIPAYNSSDFIDETIRSVLSQSYYNIEVIITDDCSSDNTAEIVASFDDVRIKFFQNESNLGVEGNWNYALRKANGLYIKLMGADDLLCASFIEEQVKILESPVNSSVVLVTSHKKIINQDGTLIMTKKFPGSGKFSGLAALRKSLRRGTNIIGEPVAGLFRRNILAKTGYYNGENLYMIDLDLWSRILLLGDLYVLDCALYSFRISEGSLSTGIGFGQMKLFNAFIDKLYTEKVFNLKVIDKYIAKLMSIVMSLARNMVYLIYFNKKTP